MKRINLSNKSFTTMYKELRFLVEPNMQKVGEIACIKYGINAEEYKKKLISCRAELYITKSSQEKLLSYYDWIKQFQQQLEEDKDSYETVIYSFLMSDYLTVDEFCKLEPYSKMLFEYTVGVIRFLNPELYNYYLNEINRREKIFEDNIILSGKQLIEKMDNGIVIENGKSREFDIIDYYLAVKVNPMKLFYILKRVMAISEMGEFKNFARRYSQINDLSYTAIQKKFDDLVVYNCKNDSDIETGTIITDEQKFALISYFLENNIPITEETYYAGLLRYRDNTFDFVAESVKPKINKK